MHNWTLLLLGAVIAVALPVSYGQQAPWWWQFTRATTTRRPAVTTTTTRFVPTFPAGFSTMQPGVAKTTPGSTPINDNPTAPCGYTYYTEKDGASIYNMDQGIVGGTDAKVNEFPWQVRINYNNGFICGGSIVSDRHILTAAHCIIGAASGYSVTLGDYNRNAAEANEKTYKISKIVVHPQNSQESNQFDLAILVTTTKIALDRRYIRPVCLPSSAIDVDSFVNQNGLVSGWGKTTEQGSTATILQKGTVPILSQAECIKSYGGGSITSDMMCAGYKAGGIDSCQGDSGGPLVILASNGRFYLQGVTSWGYGCARSGYPGVYARVASAIDWVKSTMSSTF